MIAHHTFAAIDFESAGAQRGMTDVPVQIGMATWSQKSGHADPFVSFIRADRPITWSAQKVHGISSDDLSEAPALMTLWPHIKGRLSNRIAVAHGHGTEKRYLRAFPAHGFGPWVDTLQLARAAWPELQSHALGDVCESFQLTGKITQLIAKKTWHDALYDATASLVVLEHLINQFDLAESPVDLLLHPDTTEWHRFRR
ncbi:MAG: 3'-5' exonuclease [Verrucomicrobiae bacterium]|nr:3'-5' exonuclease [Verrucomicrobiae bacterium]NNJ43787.1 3'-5' exonuclease [Akkermansiaceae bacterium]